jgi:hypothetical protein
MPDICRDAVLYGVSILFYFSINVLFIVLYKISRRKREGYWFYIADPGKGIVISVYNILHYVVEKGKASRFNFIKPTETATLTTYMMPYVLYGISVVTGFSLPDWSKHGVMSTVNCCCFALIIIFINDAWKRFTSS